MQKGARRGNSRSRRGKDAMILYHYYEREHGPLRNLSDLAPKDAQKVLGGIRARGEIFASRRPEGYLARRRELEAQARVMFLAKGGRPMREVPHYFVVERCPWLETWYRDAAWIKLPVEALNEDAVSFTYGDMFPTFSPRVQDGREYRNTVYTLREILPVIDRYGLPQQWNAGGELGPERYVEAQVWCDPSRELFLP